MRVRARLVALACVAILTEGAALAQELASDAPTTPAAALGTAFTYQGRLIDGGNPANGTYDLQLRLLDALADGSQVGSTVTKDNVVVADGLFSVELDFSASIFTGQALWLEIGVRPGASSGSYAVLSPRQPLNPVPFAHYGKAGVATDVQCAGCVSLADLKGGAASDGQVLTATSATNMHWQSPVWPTGSGSAGQVTFWTAADALGGSSALSWDSANSRLGIGTSAPQDTLEVAGSLRLPQTASSSTGVLRLGSRSFLHGYSPSESSNTFVGSQAGNFTLTGLPNTGVGKMALASLTTGIDNVAVGALALQANTRGRDNTAVGDQSLYFNTTASGNTAVGNRALSGMGYDNGGVEYTTGNTAVGAYSMWRTVPSSTDDGKSNTAVGYFSLGDNFTGSENTACGTFSLRWNKGWDNTAVGYNTLYANTLGYGNVAVGSEALANNTTAARNTAVGRYALYTQSYGNAGTVWNTENTGLGYKALYSNGPTNDTEGLQNTAVGAYSLQENTTGSFNTAVGAEALQYNKTGRFNVAVGLGALRSNTTGTGSLAAGEQALYRNTLGTDNVALGNWALSSNTTAGRNTAVGRYALSTQSYSNGGTAWDANNTAIGFYALFSNEPTSTTVGRRNTAVGGAAGDSKTVTDSTFLGYDSDASVNLLTNAMALGYGAKVDASNKVRIGNSSVTVIEGQVDWSFPSDIRHKKDVDDLLLGLDFVLQLRPVQYRLIDGNDRLDMGFIAQDIEALVGEAYNVVGAGEDVDRTLSLRRGDLIAPLVKAVQEQQERIEAQQASIEERDRRIERLESMVAELAAQVAVMRAKTADRSH